MRVFNLTNGVIDYRGRHIAPNGGSLDYPEMTFVPNRDKKLQDERVLAFGELPAWFMAQRFVPVVPVEAPTLDEVVEAEPFVESKPLKKK